MAEKYDHKSIEKKWQAVWEDSGHHSTQEGSSKPKKYVLDMFPYPSGEGLHMGHTESYTASDVVARHMKMQGYDVLHPQGFDSFGLPAENYAIKTGVHPSQTTETNANNYIRQMKALGLSHDLSNLVYTSHPDYYKWTQYIVGKFFENGLVVRKTDKINWCPSCSTGIANEQVLDGKCERCKTEIEQKEIPGWFFRTTDFADALDKDLDDVDWPETTKKNQRAWIGKSEGTEFDFEIKDTGRKITVFTTRPDTLFGVTYVVLAPEHPLLRGLKSQIANLSDVEQYIEKSKNKPELERKENKEKTGEKLEGVVAINPANGEEIPVFVADYVLGNYGTGAVMAVPAHDERDFEFAKMKSLPVICVITPEDLPATASNRYKIIFNEIVSGKCCYEGNGLLRNSSDEFDGISNVDAKQAITKKYGRTKTQYKLRDWSVSRQRYWGCPIPIVYSPQGEAKFVGEENLPWLLPVDVDFMPTGISPLSKSVELKERTEKIFGKGWTPEVDTMDTFVDSSWYFLRYPDTKNDREFCSPEKLKRWLPVDLYIGGAEHTYMHLLYARFFIKAMKKIGLVDFNEPFVVLRHQGMVLDKNGVKMSKSKGNVVNPDDMVERFGADAVRVYMLFSGPLEENVIWNEESVVGPRRFLERVWKLENKVLKDADESTIETTLHKTIKKVSEDIETFDFNTAISSMMILVNEIEKLDAIPKSVYEILLKLLAPFAPHITEELWHAVGNTSSIHISPWPSFDASRCLAREVTIAIQVGGKLRDTVVVPVDTHDDTVKNIALARPDIVKWVDGKDIKKVILVKGRLINIVVGD